MFSQAVDWDSPAQLNDINTTGVSSPGALPMNFGTQANYNLYFIPSLITTNGQAFIGSNRLWISGDQSAFTAEMSQLNDQLMAASIPHTWVQGAVRVHSWNSGWLDGALTDLDANATLNPPSGGTLPPVRTGGQPTGVLASGTSQTTLSLMTDQSATCRYATTAGLGYASMTNVFGTTGGTAQSTVVTGLADGASYTYYVRCQDSVGNTDSDDFVIGFAVSTAATNGSATSFFSGVEDPLSENGMWGTTGSWTSLKKSNGAYSTAISSAARLVTPVVVADQYAEITFDQDPGSAGWPGVMTRVQGPSNGSGYLAIAYAGQVRLYRTDDNGTLNFVLLASANANLGAAPRRLHLESQGANHRVYFNGVLMLSYTDSGNVYTAGQPGIAAAFSGGTTVRILSFTGGALAGLPDTTPPVLSGGQPTGVLPSGTSQTTLSLTTDESAMCRYATTAGVGYASMTNAFSTTGGAAQSTVVTGLADGGNYSYYVRCQDSAGNADSDDFVITFSVNTAGSNGSGTSVFSGVEDPLSENGMWGTTGSWTSLKKNNGAYATAISSAARLVTPVVVADQYADITFDQDPGSSGWPGVMTRVQGPANGSGYLAIAYAGQVRLYRTDDNGTLNFVLLASANADLGAAPRRLRLESQGANHRVYFNGVLMLSYTDSGNVYTAGQPGIAAVVLRRHHGQDTLLHGRSPCRRARYHAAGAEWRAADRSVAVGNEPDDSEPDDERECNVPLCDDRRGRLRVDDERVRLDRKYGAVDAGDWAGGRRQLQLLRALPGQRGECRFRRFRDHLFGEHGCRQWRRGERLLRRGGPAIRERDVGHNRVVDQSEEEQRSVLDEYHQRGDAGDTAGRAPISMPKSPTIRIRERIGRQ